MKKLLTEDRERIVFYDGECGLCSRFVQVILKNKTKEFYFIALQTELAEQIMDQHHITINMNTLFLLEDGEIFKKSTAALRISRNLRFPYKFISYVGYLVPRYVRDKIYLFVAKRRFTYFPGTCMLPNEQENKYFLK